ncbi:MAG: hypothetical protein JXA89_19530, partial [Anaerolineae bacterium]|nr:hypothetical protein [Anaerolineae bacterium]
MKPAVGWPAFLLTMAALLAAVGGLIDAEWSADSIVFLPLVLVAALVSTALAHTTASNWNGALLLMAIGLLFAGNAASQFFPPLVGGLSEVGQAAIWLGSSLWRRGSPPPFNQPLSMPAFVQLNESRARLARLGQRLATWASGLWMGQIEANPPAFLFVAGLLLWGCVAWAVWVMIRQKKPMPAMLPLGSVLALSTYLSDASLGYLFGFVACAILLHPAVRLSWHERQWQQNGLDYSTEVQIDTWQVAIAVTVAILILAAITPAVNVPRLADALWRTISHPQKAFAEFLSRFFAGVQPDSPPDMPQKDGPVQIPGLAGAALPRAHLLGGRPELS